MLPGSQRLSAKELDSVMEKGRVLHSSLFLARFVLGTKSTKIAAVAPQKSFTTSVSRNKVRRKIYTAARTFISKLSTNHTMLIAKSTVKDASTEQIQDNLKEIFVKMGVLR